jgi:PBSX family phage terminase large subunit
LRLNPKQIEANKVLERHRYSLLYGGARSGKTWLICLWIVGRAFRAPGSKHLITRRYGVDVRGSIWKQTLKDILLALDLHIGQDYTQNDQEMELRLENGSVIICSGLDDKERVDKVLGREYATIYVNESQDVPWPTVRTLRTRLSQNTGVYNKFVADLNPTTMAHWTYKIFFKGVDPETNQPLPNIGDYGKIQLSPYDNADNLPADYISSELETLVGARRQRFLEGTFSSTTDLQVFAPTTYEWSEFTEWARGKEASIRLTGGLDIGFEDADALAILAYVDGDPKVWVVYEYKSRREGISDLAEAVKTGRKWVFDHIPTNAKELTLYGDTGGIGKKVCWELSYVQGIPIQPAYKQEKRMAIEFLQEEINNSRLLVPKGGVFADECTQIVWTRDDNGAILREIDERAYHPDLMDAILYPMRYIWSYGNGALRKTIGE